MRILVLSPYLPHPLSGHGGGEYIYGLVKYLSRSHAVTLATFADHHEQKLAKDLSALPLTVHIIPRRKGRQATFMGNLALTALRLYQLFRSIILWQPYYVSKFYHPAMAKMVAEETRTTPYDIVQVEFAQMGQYVRFVQSGKTVLRAHDVVFRPAYRSYKKAQSLIVKGILFVEWCRWASYEPTMVRQYDHVLTFTEQDSTLLKRLARINHVSYNARGIEIPERTVSYDKRDSRTLLFIGLFSHVPNADAALWLCTEIFPLVNQQCPNVVLNLVGKNASTALRAAAEKFPSIKIPGFVEDLEAYLNTTTVFVAPIRIGGGIKTKIIHAQSYGLPVVTTPLGAEGIVGANDSTMVIGRTASEIAEGILKLLRDRNKASEIGEKGRKVVTNHYAWGSAVRQQEAIYESLLVHTPKSVPLASVNATKGNA